MHKYILDSSDLRYSDGDVKSGGRCGIISNGISIYTAAPRSTFDAGVIPVRSLMQIDMECREVGSAIMKGMITPRLPPTAHPEQRIGCRVGQCKLRYLSLSTAATCEYAPLSSTVRSMEAEKAVLAPNSRFALEH
ncbi:hypothetical protein EDD18DRAFT_1112601 [Armillaria luteobubalina]|uniref:Uncharacterized protein n=1 Tax=Armillaria luteobubalina TaxID=153913 RepID=A0AA39PEW2_9AGAR|nr:hypothetical protein EDD18DRAFT_1112601 [Armillaria luteobubalina]